MKYLVCLLLLPFALVAENPERATLKKKMKEFLKNYNGSVTVDSPDVYKGQLSGYATGGGVHVRNKVFNRKPVTITPPSYSAGCGGIDLHMGSASLIKQEELVDAMKGIVSGATSYAFLLAMESVSPSAKNVMADLQKLATELNQIQINSCEVGQQLTGMVWPKNKAASQHICSTLSAQNGSFSSFAEAKHDCSNEKQSPTSADNGDAFYGEYNLAWEVIKKDPYLRNSPEFAELFMSLTGTYIMDSGGTPKWYPSKVEDSRFLAALLYGEELEGYKCVISKGASQGNLFQGKCLEIDENAVLDDGKEGSSWFDSVHNKLISIQDKIYTDTPLEEDEKHLINSTTLPVLRTICAMSVFHKGFAPVDLARISKLVAIDIMVSFIKEVIQKARATALQIKQVQYNSDSIDHFVNNLSRVESIVYRFEDHGRILFNEIYAVEKLIDMVEGKIEREIGL